MAVANVGVALLDNLPENLKPPDGLVLKPSSIATNEIGVWCSESIDVGKRFGPFCGEIVTQYKSGQSLDNYAWEVLDLDTHEFLHYVDSSDLSKSNWLRFVRCANYFEEQNIVSEQDGTEIYYKVIKAIQPNEELLTWYDLSQFKKSVRARSKLRKAGRKPLKKLKISQNNAAILDSPEDSHDRKFGDVETPSGPKKRPESDSDRSPRSRRKPSILDSYVCGEEALQEMDGRRNRLSSTKSNSPKILSDSTSPKLNESSAQMKLMKLGDEQKVLSSPEDLDDHHFHFMMTSEHLVQDGRHFLFKCDVCYATYRHAFSLKRHFLRRHVNYAYITEHDRVNCGLNGRRYLELQAQVNGDPNLTKSEPVKNECTADSDGKTSIQTLRIEPEPNSDSKDKLDAKEVTHVPCEINGKENEDHCDAYRPVVSPISLPESNNSNHELSTSNNSSGTGSDVISVAKVISASEETKVSEKNSLLDAFFESQLAVLNKKLAALDGRQETSPLRKEFTNYDQPILLESVKVFWCEHCNHLYPGLPELKAHYKDEHPFAKDVREKNEWRCSECELKFLSRKEYDKHVRSHEENMDLTCPKCGKVFKTLGRFRKHEENVQCVGRIRCRICPADFANRRNFLEHYRRFHEDQIDAETTTVEAPDSAPVSTPENSLDSVEKECDRQDRDTSLKLANQTHGFRFACTICKKRFREYHYMCRHRRLAHQAPKRRLGNKHSLKDEVVNREREEDPSAFYANVAKNIAENLSFFIDGKRDSLESQQHHQGDGMDVSPIGQIDPDWCSMNFDESHDPRTWHDCVPQIAVDLSGKVDSDSRDKRQQVVDVIQTRIQPCSNPQFVPRNKQQRLEALNFYNGNPRLRYVCLVCAARYESMDKLDDHYSDSHWTVQNDHIELDVDCSPPVFAQPTTQGILGKLITPEVAYRQEYRCTKCEEKFDKIDLLHSHIVTCGPLPSNEMSAQSASKTYFVPRKFRSYGLFRGQKLRKVNSEKKKTRPQTPVDDTPLAQEEPTRRTTRSLDHSYDPRRHVRRRDTRPILDTEKCRACLKRFKNLLELERHARVCSKKQLFRTSVCQSDIGMKCIYCLKHFTYKLSLKKHLIDVCKVKKQLLETDLLSDEKIEEEGLLLQQIEENLPLATVKEKVNDLTKKKKRRRARLGLKPSVKKAIEFKLKKRRCLNRVKLDQTIEPEPVIVEESTATTETQIPEKTADIFTNDIGKRSRKMTVKALESVTLQMTLDCISNSEKLRASNKSAKKAKNVIKLKKQQMDKKSDEIVKPSAVVPNSEESNQLEKEKPAEKNDSQDVGTKDIDSVTEDVTTKIADVVSNGDDASLDAKPVDEEAPLLGSKKGRKRKLPETKTASKSEECVPPKKSVINSRPKNLLDDDCESLVSSGDPYEFHVEKSVQNGQEENNILRFTKDGRLRKKPGRKPRKLVSNGQDKSHSLTEETMERNSAVKERKDGKSAVPEVSVKTRKHVSDSKDRKTTLERAVPLVFSKRVANLQKRLKKL